MKPTWGSWLRRTLLTGFFIIAPISLSFMLLAWLVAVIDGALAPLLSFLGRPIPGLGILTGAILVLGAGVLGNNIFGRRLLEFAEDFLLKIPVFNWLYRTIKQVSKLFAPAGRAGFSSVALVEYPRPGVYSLGFATKKFVLDAGGVRREMVSVFVPTNNLYIGDTILAPAAQVVEVDLNQQQMVQAMLSAGAALPDIIKSLSV